MYVNKLLILFLILGPWCARSQSTQGDSLLVHSRKTFAAARTHKDSVDSAIAQFEQLVKNPDHSAVAQAYIGSLYALKGKYAFLPPVKLAWVNKGINKMNAALEKDPTNVEILFVRGSTFLQLPGLFGKKNQGEKDIESIFNLWPDNKNELSISFLQMFVAYAEKAKNLRIEHREKTLEMKQEIRTRSGESPK